MVLLSVILRYLELCVSLSPSMCPNTIRSVFESQIATPTMNLFLIIRTGLATGFLIFALTFITNAVKSWNEAPSVTSSNIY